MCCGLDVTAIFLLSVWFLAFWTKVLFSSFFTAGTTPIWLSVILSLLSGPNGEECGWRGYLRPELEKRFGFLNGALLGGVIWAFWHTVLWVVDNEYTSGGDLAIYVISNVVVMTALNLIMATVLERENNLVYAFLIHFCFNLPYSFLVPRIEFYVILSVLHAVAAGMVLWIREIAYKKWV